VPLNPFSLVTFCPSIGRRLTLYVLLLLQDPTQEFLVRCSYIEIYNENITDLLNPKSTNLKIHTNPKVIPPPVLLPHRHSLANAELQGGVFVAEVQMPVVGTGESALALIAKGSSNRHVGETRMNSESSRSHSIFKMVIESKDKVSEAVRIAELNMVDLAGSERQSQTQATGTFLLLAHRGCATSLATVITPARWT